MASTGGAAPGTYTPTPTKKTQRSSFFSDSDVDWLRPDGRGFHQCRPAFFRTGAVNSAAGSAYAEFGNTKVIVSVFGPRESKKAMVYSDVGRLNCNVSCTTFATPVRGLGSDNKEFSSMLHKALEGAIMLETFPKTTVDVFALVLESGGSDLPVVISCASLALADAGIMMYDLVAGVSVSCLGRNLIIDPILEEESFQDGSLMITCMPSRYEVTQLSITGEWSTAKLNEVRHLNCKHDLSNYRKNHIPFMAVCNQRCVQFGCTDLAFHKQAMQLCLDACSKLDKIMRACLKEAASASLD
ncbi:hypothetical protein POTOM_033881 [Populus tomentosa]|uniref:Uncharacterized protein n=1 Tax=Populus tomentosa TaxID=118781 RepID=A0A8X8CNU1_POPTO|nr:hypothetical protein POTOM_033881 [Populus tomentosa]